MLTDFTIKNFRGIKELTLPSLKRVNLFVGKNGVGKTSVLEAIQLYASDFDSAVAWEVLCRRDEDVLVANNLELLQRLPTAGFGFFAVGPSATPITVSPTQDEKPGVPSVLLRTTSGTLFHDWDKIPTLGSPIPRSRKLPLRQLIVPSTMMGNSLFSDLWREVELTSKEDAIIKIVGLLVPKIERITIRRYSEKAGLVPIAKVHGNVGPVPLSRLGEGVQRIASIALALFAVEGGVLLIDEFENGLHYAIQRDVWSALMRLSNDLNVQVFATTHSRDTVYSLAEAAEGTDDACVIRLDRRGDQITARTIRQETLEGVAEQEVEIR